MRAPVFYLAYALIAVNCSADDPPRTLTTNQSTREQPITAHGNSTVAATVSATGAGTIDIPIWVPPGIGNLKPEVGLHYDSHGGNGFLGAGWALSGLSGITRCSGTVATNGAVLPVTHTANDRFCLDGKQLSLVAGTYGQHGSVYRTERDTFARITAHSEASTPGGPRTFIVESKNGLTYRYEAIGGKFVAFATIQPVPRDPVPVEEWVLAEVADRAGNRVRYSYEYANNLPALTKIEYPLRYTRLTSTARRVLTRLTVFAAAYAKSSTRATPQFAWPTRPAPCCAPRTSFTTPAQHLATAC